MACGSTMNMRDLELRSVIKFLTKEGKKLKEIHERMNAVYDNKYDRRDRAALT